MLKLLKAKIKGENVIKYKNINYVTFIAMFMIINIHFFKTFQGEVSDSAYNLMLLLRGFALPAVTLYLTNTAFTSFYLKKGVNYKSLYLFIIIPTLLLTQVQHYMFGMDPVVFEFSQGFNNSWFGEMYIYMMLLVPLALYLDNKTKLTRSMILIYSIIFTIWGYWFSVNVHNPTISNLKVAMMFPYLGLTFFMYRIIEFFMNNMEKIEKSKIIKPLLVLIIVVCSLFEAAGYAGLLDNDIIVRSYFSPVTIIFALSMWLLVYSSDFSKLPEIRTITRSSYFLFFIHWILIRSFENYWFDFASMHVWITYVIVIIGAYLVSTILFSLYSTLVLKVMKL